MWVSGTAVRPEGTPHAAHAQAEGSSQDASQPPTVSGVNAPEASTDPLTATMPKSTSSSSLGSSSTVTAPPPSSSSSVEGTALSSTPVTSSPDLDQRSQIEGSGTSTSTPTSSSDRALSGKTHTAATAGPGVHRLVLSISPRTVVTETSLYLCPSYNWHSCLFPGIMSSSWFLWLLTPLFSHRPHILPISPSGNSQCCHCNSTILSSILSHVFIFTANSTNHKQTSTNWSKHAGYQGKLWCLINGNLPLFSQFLTSFLIILQFFWKAARKIPKSRRDCLIMHSLCLSSFASLSEYGPHRLPISLVCRRLQRLLQLADPPGRGPRARPSSSATPERQSQRAATAAAGAETQAHTGYPPSTSSLWLVCLGHRPWHHTSPDWLEKDTVLLVMKKTVILTF